MVEEVTISLDRVDNGIRGPYARYHTSSFL